LQEDAEAASNPDHNKVIRVGAETRRTGVVKDKHGNIIGAMTAIMSDVLPTASVRHYFSYSFFSKPPGAPASPAHFNQ
jgi:hypothetical protein